jgi:hypothetical protein
VACRQYGTGDHVMWLCDRTVAPRCDACGRRADTKCGFPFKGKRAGEFCEKHLCSKCAAVVSPAELPWGQTDGMPGKVAVCQAHYRFVKRRSG